MINHSNEVIKSVSRRKLYYPHSTLADIYRYLIYKFPHLDFNTDISNISNTCRISAIDDPITHTVSQSL